MRSKLTSLIFVASCFLSLNLLAVADSQARIVRLSYIEGTVRLDRGDGNGYIRAFLNMPLIEGTSLLTKDDGRAEVEFEDGSTVRLTPNTIINFTELRLRNDGSRATSIALTDGATYFNVRHDKDELFRLTVGTREIELADNSHFRVIHSAGQDPFELRIAVFKGQLRFVGEDGQRVGIRKNETLTLDFNDQGRYFLAKGLVEESHDYWDKERDDAYNRLQLKAARNAAYVDDLQRYGRYITVSGYGSVWRPLNVNISWDPFTYGSWVYYPGYGYIFVSNYSWGWTPYRYGSWVHISNHGWCWRPSNNYNHWARGPVIVDAPRGYQPPVAPTPIAQGRPNLPIVPIGRIDAPDGGLPRRLNVDGNDTTRVIVQDRISGVTEVDRSSRQESWIRRRNREIEDRDNPATGIATRTPGSGVSGGTSGGVSGGAAGGIAPETKTGGRRRPEGEGIDAHRISDNPVRDGVPAGSGVSTGGVVRDQVVNPPAERPTRPPRYERTDEPRPQRLDRPADSPVIVDRPSRPMRNDNPPPRVDNPPVRPQAPINDRPSSPPPQRMSPPPTPTQQMKPPPPPDVQPQRQTDSPQL